MESLWLAVGLGNPGKRYERTRHNAGARALARLAENLRCRLKRTREGVLLGESRSGPAHLVLARPTTYMNDSGPPVAALARRFKIPPERLVVLHDEIDLLAGVLRLKRGGGTAGHRGLDSVVRSVGGRDFFRVRIGVGRPDRPIDPADWVLENMTEDVSAALAAAEAEAAEAVLAVIHEGLERAQARFHTR
ncbi:MAG: aminoacyl-tRNA hydrolase [Actinomycetota bacterium]